jgi:uncharacterized protein DUF1905/bacteriocin resistance YdeI/OmpD-like protein
VLATGGTTTGIEVPPEVVEVLGGGRRAKVAVTLAGHRYRTSLAAMGGRVLVGVSAEVRAAAGVAAGDQLEVDLVLDDEPRVVTVPDDLAAALAAEPGAADAFAALSYSLQRRHVLAVEGARAAQTRARRVAAVVAAVTG